MTKSQADRAKRQYMEKINSHREVAGDAVTLVRFFQEHYWNEETKEYGDELRTKRASTRRDMRNAVRQVILPRFGNRRMESIKTGEIQAYLMSLIGPPEEGKVSRQTVQKYKV